MEMQRSDDVCYMTNTESDGMKKLEELLKSAYSLICALSTDELPHAFRLAFKLLDQTGKNICLARNVYQQQCFIGNKRRHNSCSFKPLRVNNVGTTPPLDSTSELRLKYLQDRLDQGFLNLNVSENASSDKIGGSNGQEDFRSEASAADFTSAQPVSDHYESGSQSSGKDTVDASIPTNWLNKMKDETAEDGSGNPQSPKEMGLGNSIPYPQCSSAPTLTANANTTSSCTQSPKSSLVNPNFPTRKDKRRHGGLMPLPNPPFSRLSEVEFSPKRLPEIPPPNVPGCPSKNWKITHSDRLNALIDECERIVDGRKVFKCKFCGKMYDIKSSMRYHMKIIHLQLHLRTSEMQCRICGKQFTCISAVNRHQLKCSANSTSNFTSSNPIQSSCGTTFLGKPRQSSLSTFSNQPSSAFLNLNATPGMRWSSSSGSSGRQSNQPINPQNPFTFSPTPDTTAYISPSVTTAFPSQPSRPSFDLEASRFSAGGTNGAQDISPHHLVHSVHNLVDGMPQLSFNEVFLASLGRTNGANSVERKPGMFDEGFMGAAAVAAAAHNFLAPSPSKRLRKPDTPNFSMDGRIGDNLYERLFPSQTETVNNAAAVVAAAAAASGTAIDLSLNASC